MFSKTYTPPVERLQQCAEHHIRQKDREIQAYQAAMCLTEQLREKSPEPKPSKVSMFIFKQFSPKSKKRFNENKNEGDRDHTDSAAQLKVLDDFWLVQGLQDMKPEDPEFNKKINALLAENPFIKALKEYNDACIQELESKLSPTLFSKLIIGSEPTTPSGTIYDIMATAVDIDHLAAKTKNTPASGQSRLDPKVQPCINAFANVGRKAKKIENPSSVEDCALMWLDSVWADRSAIQYILMGIIKYNAIRLEPGDDASKLPVLQHQVQHILDIFELLKKAHSENHVRTARGCFLMAKEKQDTAFVQEICDTVVACSLEITAENDKYDRRSPAIKCSV